MPSEQRLHPSTVLFAFARSAKVFLVPGLLLLISSGRSSGGPAGTFGRLPENWELWLMLLMVPSSAAAIARYVSCRIRYERSELVIRSGILFRNERHVPYARIQNLDAVQNVFHRALGVVEVRVDTGGGRELEARLSVLPAAALEEMRRRVFQGRDRTPNTDAAVKLADAPAGGGTRVLLHLPTRELLLFGFLENRGLVLIGAAYGLAWEFGFLERLWEATFDAQGYSRYFVPTSIVEAIGRGGPLPAGALAVILAGVAGLLVLVRIISMGWAAVRLYDFRLEGGGEDLHAAYGLLTRVAATIPLRRIQTLTIQEGPLHRLVKRASITVQTAGGVPGSDDARTGREWLAPLIRRRDITALTHEVLPNAGLEALHWRPVHRGAFRRAAKPPLALSLLLGAGLASPLEWWALPWLAAAAVCSLLLARTHVNHLAWSITDHVVAFRSGWLWKKTTITPIAKMQAVAQLQSPFDRRASMARIRVDSAGCGDGSHRIDIPYLAHETARGLHRQLAAAASATAFSAR